MRVTLLFLAMWYGHPTVGQPRMIPARRLDHEWHLALDRQAVADFPPSEVAEEAWATASAHVDWLGGRLRMAYAAEPHTAPWWREWESDARWCLRAWSLLQSARSPHNTPAERSWYRLSLENHLGPEDFALRRMPPPMPVWWFRAD